MMYKISISWVQEGKERMYLNDSESEYYDEWNRTKYIFMEAATIQEALEKAKTRIAPGTNWWLIEHQEETAPRTYHCHSLWNETLHDDLEKIIGKK